MYRILIVDDSEENLAILKNALQQDYRISVAKDGQTGLNAMNALNPDLVLLDIHMPGIDGYETLRKIRASKRFCETPVIFVTGATEITDKKRGFEPGAVDYITKPFEITEVKLRVKTHLELSKSREERKELLGSTLVGTIQAMLEILSLTNPFAFEFSSAAKKLAGSVARDIGYEEVWKVEVAAMLSLMGTCVSKPEIAERIICGKNVTLEERKQFASHPNVGSKLVAKIPRLEDLAEMIKNQMEPMGELEYDGKNIVLAGSQILAVVINYLNYVHRGQTQKGALVLLKQNRAQNNIEIIKALDRVLQRGEVDKVKTLSVTDLREGMIIEADVIAEDGSVVIKKGTAVNGLVIEHLKLLSELGKQRGSVVVRVHG